MILETSYTDRETTRKINKAVGPPFSWKERFKLNGIGSKRMVISSVSEEIKPYIYEEHYESKANIELRPKGIIVHFRFKLQVYSWIIPYADLKIEQEEGLKLIASGESIDFNKPGNSSFLRKLKRLQKEYLDLNAENTDR